MKLRKFSVLFLVLCLVCGGLFFHSRNKVIDAANWKTLNGEIYNDGRKGCEVRSPSPICDEYLNGHVNMLRVHQCNGPSKASCMDAYSMQYPTDWQITRKIFNPLIFALEPLNGRQPIDEKEIFGERPPADARKLSEWKAKAPEMGVALWINSLPYGMRGVPNVMEIFMEAIEADPDQVFGNNDSKPFGRDYKRLEGKRVSDAAGEYYRLVGTFPNRIDRNRAWTGVSYIWLKESTVYRLTFDCVSENFERERKLGEKIMSTFRFR